MDNSANQLASEIILKAINDYQAAYALYKGLDFDGVIKKVEDACMDLDLKFYRHPKTGLKLMQEIEEFFRSDWFQTLSENLDIPKDPEKLIYQIKRASERKSTG
jgi:hypothetical protein